MSLFQPFFHHHHHHHTVNILEQNMGVYISLSIVVFSKVTGCEIVGFGLLKLDSVMDLV